ncbi:hypothetical protein C8J56DRAFT_851082 [Mycena floridula]|nr:hypothetical protein C8J56DRAFT_851082 [Mycena floridula]
MSLSELSRNCFQSGISAPKWLRLCKTFIAKDTSDQSTESIETTLSNSVLALYRTGYNDPDLQEYFRSAIQDGILPVAVFVSTFLRAAPDLRSPATLDSLVRIALDAHYASGKPPIGSVVAQRESSTSILSTVQDALALLRIAHQNSLPTSHFHQLTTSSAELVILLLSCVSDISQISVSDAMMYFGDVNDLLSSFRLSSEVRNVLDNFLLTLSLFIGDDTTKRMQTVQLSLGKSDILGLGPNSNTDIVTFSLELHHLVAYRATDFGAGSPNAVASLVATFRWTGWTPAVFYTQLLLSSFAALSQSQSSSFIWKAFVVGRLPHLLVSLEKVLSSQADSTVEIDWRSAMQSALAALFRRPELFSHCEIALARADAQSETPPRSLWRDLIQQLLSTALIDQRFALAIDPMIANDSVFRMQSEAQDHGFTDLASYMESKLAPESNVDDHRNWLDRVCSDPHCHFFFANAVLKLFTSFAMSLDVSSLSHLCKLLQSQDRALDIVSLHVQVTDIIFQGLDCLESYSCETVGDPQTALAHLGEVVLFLQDVLHRFHLDAGDYTLGERTISARYLRFKKDAPREHWVSNDAHIFGTWQKSLFTSDGSDGIEDGILRTTSPKTLLRISPLLFVRAIQSNAEGKLDIEILRNGVSYFSSPLLSWTLCNVLESLMLTVQHKGFISSVTMEIVQTLVLSAPQTVLTICGPRILMLLSQKQQTKPSLVPTPLFDPEVLVKRITEALGTTATHNQVTATGQISLHDPTQAIQTALTMARAGKAPYIDVERCIRTTPPSKFLQLLWSELVSSATVDLENCKRLGVFILTMPRSKNNKLPPLLPIFMMMLPSLLTVIELQQPAEQMMNVELLVTLVSSVLTSALHFELANSDFVFGQTTSSFARRLASELRGRKSHASLAVAQRLSSSQSFVTNFPGFKLN